MVKKFETVTSPHKFKPALLKDKRIFTELWNTKQPWVLSNLSHLAYFKKNYVIAAMGKLEATTLFYDVEGAQAFLSIWQDKAVLVFRGTQIEEYPKNSNHELSLFRRILIMIFIKFPLNPFSLLGLSTDLLADFKFFQKPFNDNKKVGVHSGFLEEFEKLWPKIKPDLPSLPLWVTGHSLGGAIATLAGMKYPFESVTTFGEPRVGQKIYLSFKSKEHIRYVNGNDPVTKLPPRFFSYYKHHGNKKHISDADGETSSIYDHSIIYYSENLSK